QGRRRDARRIQNHLETADSLRVRPQILKLTDGDAVCLGASASKHSQEDNSYPRTHVLSDQPDSPTQKQDYCDGSFFHEEHFNSKNALRPNNNSIKANRGGGEGKQPCPRTSLRKHAIGG